MKPSILAAAVRRLWSLVALRSGEYTGTDPARFERLHLIEDPYKLGTPRERARFAQTNAAIRREIGAVATILEVGAGEGEQTRALAELGRVTGIEVSARAVARAQAKLPDAEFLTGTAEDTLALVGTRRFDLAVICEILYLTPNAAQIVADVQRVTPRILVTNYAKRAPGVEPLLTGPGWQRLDDIAAEGTVWWCHLWSEAGPK